MEIKYFLNESVLIESMTVTSDSLKNLKAEVDAYFNDSLWNSFVDEDL